MVLAKTKAMKSSRKCELLLVGFIFEILENEPFEETIQRLVFRPLGMVHATFQKDTVVWNASMGAKAPLRDWVPFMQIHLRGLRSWGSSARTTDEAFLKADTIKRLHGITRHSTQKRPALGWLKTTKDDLGCTISSQRYQSRNDDDHFDSSQSSSHIVTLYPSLDRAIIVVAKGGAKKHPAEKAVATLALSLLDMATSLDDEASS